MAVIKFFEKPGCINNEKQKHFLMEAGHTVISVNIMECPLTEIELRPFFGDTPLPEWFNPTAPAITRGDFKIENCSEDTALKAMLKDRYLIRRPLIEIEDEKFSGFNTSELDKKIRGLSAVLMKNGSDANFLDITTCPYIGSDTNCISLKKEPEQNWSIWLREAKQYFKAGRGEKKKFDNCLLYNLLAMSLEKFIMAILGYNLSLPLNHTFSDLIDSLEQICSLDDHLKKTILQLEKKQEICSFEDYVRTEVSDDDITLLRIAVTRIGEMADRICLKSKAPLIISV